MDYKKWFKVLFSRLVNQSQTIWLPDGRSIQIETLVVVLYLQYTIVLYFTVISLTMNFTLALSEVHSMHAYWLYNSSATIASLSVVGNKFNKTKAKRFSGIQLHWARNIIKNYLMECVFSWWIFILLFGFWFRSTLHLECSCTCMVRAW